MTSTRGNSKPSSAGTASYPAVRPWTTPGSEPVRIVDPAHCVYLDTETTGLEPGFDEVVDLAIADADGRLLVDSLVRPDHCTEWPEAEAIHGIAPAVVATAPTLAELAPRVRAAVAGKTVVIYNADFDTGFVGHLLAGSQAIECCMLAWAEHAREWSDYWGGWRWHKLVEAAAAVHFEWPAAAHRARADALACRAVWRYLHDPEERARIDAIRAARERAWQIERDWDAYCWEQAREAALRDRRLAARGTSFINHWWLGRYGVDHWSSRRRWEAEDAFARIFFGKSLRALELEVWAEERGLPRYGRQRDIPSRFKPASWFRPEAWYRRELRPGAVFVGRSQVRLLYATSEKRRLNRKFRLRLVALPDDPDSIVASRSRLRRLGYRAAELRDLEPVAERYSQSRTLWYPVYRVARKAGIGHDGTEGNP